MADRYTSVSQIVYPVEIRFEQESTGVPEYTKFQAPIMVAGKVGSAPGEFDMPLGVAIDEKTHQILAAASAKSRIQVFSETGEYPSAGRRTAV